MQISTAPWVVQSDAADPRPANYVRIRVRDNGVGMSDEMLRRIFQPFYTTKGEQGTGLGLPQVRTFMRSVGGHVCVVSQLGEGTTFDLFFPSVEPKSSQTRQTEANS